MDNRIIKKYRKAIGFKLQKERKIKGISVYLLTKNHGLRPDVVKRIENGEGGYNFNSLLIYLLVTGQSLTIGDFENFK